MDFLEHTAKQLLKESGLEIPNGKLARSPGEAAEIARELGACTVKAQVPTGKRGKAGGIQFAETAEECAEKTETILGMEIDGHSVKQVLIECRIPIAREFYAAALTHADSKSPMLLFSTAGGMDVEESAERHPSDMRRIPLEIKSGFEEAKVRSELEGLDLGDSAEPVINALSCLYAAFRRYDAELLEINPLVLTETGSIVALDCKLTMDDAATPRQEKIAALAADEKLTEQERVAREAGLKYIELGGSVGVLANGAGLTMTTMDAITHYGGSPANFLEIGGEAYTKSKTALEILLSNPNLRSLLVNFCGAFARTDVMAEGVVSAWKELSPEIPIFFTIHGTGEEEAVKLVRRELGIDPFDLMDDAVKAAVEASGGGGQ